MAINNYNNILTSVRWYNKDPKDYHILALVIEAQKLYNDLNKPS